MRKESDMILMVDKFSTFQTNNESFSIPNLRKLFYNLKSENNALFRNVLKKQAKLKHINQDFKIILRFYTNYLFQVISKTANNVLKTQLITMLKQIINKTDQIFTKNKYFSTKFIKE